MTKHEMIYFGTIFGATQYLDIFETSGITSEMLSDEMARKVFKAIRRAVDMGNHPDAIMINDFDKEIPFDLLGRINGAGNKLTMTHAVEEIKTAYKVKTLNRIGLISTAATADNYDDIMNQVDKLLTSLDGAEASGDLVKLSDCYTPYIDHVEKRTKNKGQVDGVKTYYDRLDSFIYAFEDRKLYCIGARPSEGKSTLLMNMAWKARTGGKRVGFISVESGRLELIARMANHSVRIPTGKINAGTLGDKDFQNLMDMGDMIKENDMFIYDKPNATIEEVKSAARQMKRKYKIDILYVDYLQLIKVKTAKSRREEVEQVSEELKQLARLLNIPIVVAAQLGRDADGRKPSLGDFQHSSAIEQSADAAILIWNNKKMEVDPISHADVERDDYYLLVEKNRDGAKGWIRFSFEKDFVTFTENSHQTPPTYQKTAKREYGK